MAIKRGTNTIKRKNAKNFIHGAAQKRLDETVDPFRKQVMNSLNVDAVQIDYYHIQRKLGAPCTCGSIQTTPVFEDTSQSSHAITIPNKHSVSESASVVFQDDNIFGGDLAERIFEDNYEDEAIDVSGNTRIEEIEPEVTEEGGLNGGSVNCGICYRTQHLPPYKANSKHRLLFTSHDIVGVDQFMVNNTNAPHTIEAHSSSSNGWVSFELVVPKYFKDVVYSIRNNLRYLPAEKLYDRSGKVVTLNDLRLHAGRSFVIYVRAPVFTHVVVEFSMAVEPIMANISQESMALDYGRLMTIGDIQVVLPPTLNGVENGDILIVKNRNLALMVRDKEWKATADRRTFGWRVSTRVLQPSEPMRTLAAGLKLI